MKLYKVPNNTVIDVSDLNLQTETGEPVNELEFKHVDGAYSLCYFKDTPVHLSANTEVKIKS